MKSVDMTQKFLAWPWAILGAVMSVTPWYETLFEIMNGYTRPKQKKHYEWLLV